MWPGVPRKRPDLIYILFQNSSSDEDQRNENLSSTETSLSNLLEKLALARKEIRELENEKHQLAKENKELSRKLAR